LKNAVMCPSYFCLVRVTSPSSQYRFKVIENFSSQSHGLVESSQSRVTRIVESLRVIGLQARVNVESHEISRFFYDIFCHEIAHDTLENGV